MLGWVRFIVRVRVGVVKVERGEGFRLGFVRVEPFHFLASIVIEILVHCRVRVRFGFRFRFSD